MEFKQSLDVTLSNNSINGSGSVIQSGAGRLTLTNVNTYTGSTTVSAGSTLALAGTGKIFASSRVILTAGAVFDISAATTAWTDIQSLAGDGGTVLLGANTLTVNTGLASTTFAGVINGSGNLEVNLSLAESLTLTGNNGYTGSTSIARATLALSGAGSIAASSDVNLTWQGHLDISGMTGPGTTIRSLADDYASGVERYRLAPKR